MKYPSAWQVDGSLRDIYVLNTNLQDWQRALDFLRSTYHIKYTRDHTEVLLPLDCGTVFENQSEYIHLMSIETEGVHIHCHFFLTRLIEFDIYPPEIDTESKEDAVVKFMRGLAETLDKEVILTIENMEGAVFLRVIPGRPEPEYTPITFGPAKEISREEALRTIARAYGLDENDHEAIIQKIIDSGNRPYE